MASATITGTVTTSTTYTFTACSVSADFNKVVEENQIQGTVDPDLNVKKMQSRIIRLTGVLHTVDGTITSQMSSIQNVFNLTELVTLTVPLPDGSTALTYTGVVSSWKWNIPEGQANVVTYEVLVQQAANYIALY